MLSFLLRFFQYSWEERLRLLGLVWLIHPVFSTVRLNLVTQQWLLPENAGMKPSAPHRACPSVVPVPLWVMFELAVWMKISMFSVVRSALELRISCFVYLTFYLAPESFSLNSDWKPNALCTQGQDMARYFSWKVQSHILASLSSPLKEKPSARNKTLSTPQTNTKQQNKKVYPRTLCPSWFPDFWGARWPSPLELRQREGHAKVLRLGMFIDTNAACSTAKVHQCCPPAQKNSRSVQYLHLACPVLVCRCVYHFDLRF